MTVTFEPFAFRSSVRQRHSSSDNASASFLFPFLQCRPLKRTLTTPRSSSCPSRQSFASHFPGSIRSSLTVFQTSRSFCHGSRRSSGLSGRMSFCRLLRPFALFSDCHPFRFAPVLFASAIVTVSLPLFSEFHFRFSWIHDRPLYISFHFLQHMGREHGVVVVSARGFDACFLQRPRDRR